MKKKNNAKAKTKSKIKFAGAAAAAAALGSGLLATRVRNLNKEDTQRWDDTAGVYGIKSAVNKKVYARLTELIKSELNTDMRVLEIASATGELARDIAEDCGYIVASDISEAMIQKARSRGTPDNLMWDIQDGACLTYPDGSFDAVIIVDALHAVAYPEDILDQAKRVLKENGIIIVPNHINTGGITETVKDNAKGFFGFTDYNAWNYDEYIEFIAENGLRIVKEELIEGSMPVAYVSAVKEE